MGSITRSFANNITTAGKFDGTKLTGDIPEANLSANAPAFDDNKIVNDLSTLGLRVHTQENLNASNTNSQYVDVFNDASGIDTTTNTSRNASEYVDTTTNDTNTMLLLQSETSNGSTTFTDTVGNNTFTKSGSVRHDTGTAKFGSSSIYFLGNTYITTPDNDSYFDFGTGDFTLEAWVYLSGTGPGGLIDQSASGASSNSAYILYFDGTDFGTYFSSQDANSWNYSAQGSTSRSTGQWYHVAGVRNGANLTTYVNGTSTAQITSLSGVELHNSSRNISFGIQNADSPSSYLDGYMEEIRISNIARYTSNFTAPSSPFTFSSFNATGNFTSNAISTADSSSINKAGAVITYQDNAGTNALNTDIILQLSADNGSNFSTATLTALPDFSSGIKMAKVNDLALTAGTQLKYKILFANQASGSKEARIRGVSLNY